MAVQTIRNGKIEYLAAEEISAVHCFTTRLGGVSQGYLSSMNLGTRRGDDPKNVLENYRILGNALGFQPEKLVLTRQTHTDIVTVVGDREKGAGLFAPDLPECDALITNTPGIGLVVFTADCTPIFLWDPVTGAVGAVHAGWRGTASGIVKKTVEAMGKAYGCKPENIIAAIGPNIGVCCFETDADVPQAMTEALGESVQAYIHPKGKKFYVNLKEINAWLLRQAGVKQIAIAGACTACEPDKFWSHRRVGNQRGSQGAIIICKEADK